MSCALERREETGGVSEESSCLLDVDVITSTWLTFGRRPCIICRTSCMVVFAAIGRESVRGSPRPAKVVRRIVTVGSLFVAAMLGQGAEGLLGCVITLVAMTGELLRPLANRKVV